jgi:hypothetical protein
MSTIFSTLLNNILPDAGQFYSSREVSSQTLIMFHVIVDIFLNMEFSLHHLLKEQCHRLRISSAHSKLEKLHPVVFQVYDSRWRRFASECIAKEATISAHRCTYKADETLKILEYRQHKSLYRFLNIFEAKSMINWDENGGLIKFTKRYQFRCPFAGVGIS